ncbi:hypothetical protein C8J57DRAFT_1675998 [Mycena rebaudengoi]|nr:hypothetical protein C8J57DRAFT_1675998 [Mycena rebaudengoi]
MSSPSTSFCEPSPMSPDPVQLAREPGLEEIAGDVEVGYDDRVCSSLPASTSPIRRPKRRLSLDSGLRYSLPQRTRPPLRAMTQYVGSSVNGDADAIAVPSTLGLCTPSFNWCPAASLASTPLIAMVPVHLPEPSTPAYNMLSSFVHCPPPAPGRRTSSIERSVPSLRIPQPSSSRKLPSPSPPRSRSCTLKNTITHITRPMTSPVEEKSASCFSSSPEGGPRAKLALQSLCRILDEQPLSPPVHRTHFQPYTPPPRPQAVPSTATASVSRLFSRGGGGGRHSVSIHAPPPPSIMRPSGSGASTPKAKHISFAELPESYSSTRPKNARRKGKGKGKDKESKQGEPEGWLMWLVGGVAEDRERLGVGGRSSNVWRGDDDWVA